MSDFEEEEVFLEDGDYVPSEEEPLSDDDPEASTSTSQPKKRSEPGKRGKRDASKETGKIKCHFPSCNRSYKLMDSYKKHLRCHAAEDLLTNAPGLSAVLGECRSKYLEVLKDIQELPPVGGISGDITSISLTLQSTSTESAEIFVDCVAEHLWACLPSPSDTNIEEINPTVIWTTHKTLLASLEKRSTLIELLKNIVELPSVSDESLQWFFTEFVRRLSSKVEIFYIRCLKDPYEHLLCRSSAECRDDPNDLNFQTIIRSNGNLKSTLQGYKIFKWLQRV